MRGEPTSRGKRTDDGLQILRDCLAERDREGADGLDGQLRTPTGGSISPRRGMCAGRPGEIVEVTMTRYFMLPKVTEITPESAKPAGPARPADGR